MQFTQDTVEQASIVLCKLPVKMTKTLSVRDASMIHSDDSSMALEMMFPSDAV